MADLIDLEEAIRLLKTTRPTLYRWLHSGRIQGIKVGRQWRFERAAVEAFLRGDAPRIDAGTSPDSVIAAIEEQLADLGAPVPPRDGDPVKYAILLIVALARASRATDVHLDPIRLAAGGDPQGCLRLRIDGALHERARFDPRLLPALAAGFKTLAGCDLHERQRPQTGRISLPSGSGGARDELRASFVPTLHGESVTLRILDARDADVALDRIGLDAATLARLREQLAAPYGLIVFTGLTGTGKTTTLYASLRELTRPEVKVMSLEDPVEAIVPGVVQIPVDPRAGLTYAAGVRALMTADPDVVVVSEIRDRETMVLCEQVAITGHLVLTVLHTDSAAGALRRMIEMGADPYLTGDATRAIVAHRLVRQLCAACSRPAPASAEQVARASSLVGDRMRLAELEALLAGCRLPAGCRDCGGTGFSGRALLAEVLVMTPALRAAVLAGTDVEQWQAIGEREGMVPIVVQGIRQAGEGRLALPEILPAGRSPAG